MKKHLFVAAVAVCVSASALADGQSAVKNLFDNFEKANIDIGAKAAEVTAAPTLVHGMYALTTSGEGLIGVTNEAGNLLTSEDGYFGIPQGESAFRELKPNEIAELRKEIVANIDKSKLITVRYGEGKEQLFLFSAIDCPACQSFENDLRKAAKKENTTYYVVPMSLRDLEDSAGVKQWQKVSALWCATDTATAWKAFWEKKAVPSAGTCEFADPNTAAMATTLLTTMLSSAGVKLVGVPTLVRMDGTVYNQGGRNKSLDQVKSTYWLGNNADTSKATAPSPQPEKKPDNADASKATAPSPQPEKKRFWLF